MKKDDVVILLIGLLLLAAILITIFFGGGKSRHGVGFLPDEKPCRDIFAQEKSRLDLGQRHDLAPRV